MKTKVEYRAEITPGTDEIQWARALVQIGSKYASTIPAKELCDEISGDVYLYLTCGEEESRKMRVTRNGDNFVVWGTAKNLLGVWISNNPIKLFSEGVVSGEKKLIQTIEIPKSVTMYKTKSIYEWSTAYRKSDKREVKLINKS